MIPHIKHIEAKKLIGKRLQMSLAADKTAELWGSFMPKRKEILNALNSDLFSLRVYNDTYFKKFSFENEFEKWALVEVNNFENHLTEFESFLLPAGMYAVFNYKGLSTDTRIYDYIYGKWIVESEYILDNRPHFEVLGTLYKNNDPNSEEEIWIPIKAK
jgi:AraC family transcriptional regulator